MRGGLSLVVALFLRFWRVGALRLRLRSVLLPDQARDHCFYPDPAVLWLHDANRFFFLAFDRHDWLLRLLYLHQGHLRPNQNRLSFSQSASASLSLKYL